MMFASASFEYIFTNRSTETTYCHDHFDFWFLEYTETSILTSSNCRFECTDDGPSDGQWHYRPHCPTDNTIETDRILQMQKFTPLLQYCAAAISVFNSYYYFSYYYYSTRPTSVYNFSPFLSHSNSINSNLTVTVSRFIVLSSTYSIITLIDRLCFIVFSVLFHIQLLSYFCCKYVIKRSVQFSSECRYHRSRKAIRPKRVDNDVCARAPILT